MVQMQIEVLPMVILIVYLIGMLSIGFLSNKFMIKNSNDYLLGGRRIGLLFVAASLSANNVGGGSTTGVCYQSFQRLGTFRRMVCAGCLCCNDSFSLFCAKDS